MRFNFNRSHSSIGKKSNNNTVIQNSTINSPVLINDLGSSQMLEILSKSGHYQEIQEYINTKLKSVQSTHPLFPEFSASYDSKLGKLVSTPETDTALKNHPKIVKGTYHIDFSQYPYMDPHETPWSYAYRTQTKVEMDTLSYKEYLGDMEDPFPVLTYSEGMKTIIGAPEFPEAMDATLISGNVSVPIMLRRVPCLEFGSVAFGNVSTDNGFFFTLKHHVATNEVNFHLEKDYNCSLDAQFLREKFLLEMAKSKQVAITLMGEPFYEGKLSEDSLNADICKAAPILYSYYDALIKIRNHTGFTINPTKGNISEQDYNTAKLMAVSLDGRWLITKKSYETIAVDCSALTEKSFDQSNNVEFRSSAPLDGITLCQHEFKAETVEHIFQNARISNLGEVRRALRKKRKYVTLKIKPKEGTTSFSDYIKVNGISNPQA